MAIKDKDGQAFDGARAYRLTVPAKAPVRQYWSATAYDRETHALIKNASRASRSSQVPDLEKNCRRIDRYLLRADGAGWQGDELGAHRRQPPIRGDGAPVRAGKGAVRQDLAATGHRESSMIRRALAAGTKVQYDALLRPC